MPFQTQLHNFIVSYEDDQEFRVLKHEIFGLDSYFFRALTAEPVIIDVGAHIGLATLYFKYLYPKARITAIEPNPDSFELLKSNVSINHLQNVELVKAAVSDREGPVDFYVNAPGEGWTSNSSLLVNSWNGLQRMHRIQVESRPLSEFLKQTVDLLKMDIEGAEVSLLKKNFEVICNARQVIIECHNNEKKVSKLMREIGFTVKERKPSDQQGLVTMKYHH